MSSSSRAGIKVSGSIDPAPNLHRPLAIPKASSAADRTRYRNPLYRGVSVLYEGQPPNGSRGSSQATATINAVVEEHYDVAFGARRYGEATDLGAGDVLVLPTRTSKLPFVDALVRDHDAIKAGFSGRAINDRFKYRGGYHVTFPLSDHCDFSELVDVVRAVDPEVVYTQHGFAEELAMHLTKEHGYEAYPWSATSARSMISETGRSGFGVPALRRADDLPVRTLGAARGRTE